MCRELSRGFGEAGRKNNGRGRPRGPSTRGPHYLPVERSNRGRLQTRGPRGPEREIHLSLIYLSGDLPRQGLQGRGAGPFRAASGWVSVTLKNPSRPLRAGPAWSCPRPCRSRAYPVVPLAWSRSRPVAVSRPDAPAFPTPHLLPRLWSHTLSPLRPQVPLRLPRVLPASSWQGTRTATEAGGPHPRPDCPPWRHRGCPRSGARCQDSSLGSGGMLGAGPAGADI